MEENDFLSGLKHAISDSMGEHNSGQGLYGDGFARMVDVLEETSFGDGDFHKVLGIMHHDAENLPNNKAEPIQKLITDHLDSIEGMSNAFSAGYVDEEMLNRSLFASRMDLVSDLAKEMSDIVIASPGSPEVSFQKNLGAFTMMSIDHASESSVDPNIISAMLDRTQETVESLDTRTQYIEPIAYIPGSVEYSDDTLDIQDKMRRLSEVYSNIDIDLGHYGENGDGVDGFYGEKTQQSVIAIQSHFGMDVNGVADTEFLNLLTAEVERAESAPKIEAIVDDIDPAISPVPGLGRNA